MRRRITYKLLLTLVGWAWTATWLGACATSGDLERVEARVSELENHREQLKQSMAEDVKRLEKLHAMLTAAEETLRKSGANLGIRLEQLEASVPKQTGDIDAVRHQLSKLAADMGVVKQELADRLGSTAIFLPKDLPKDKDGMWNAAKARAEKNDVRTARAIFELYEANFPEDVRAPLALWEVAKLQEGAGDLTSAIAAYQSIHDRHADAPIAPQAVMRIAEIYVSQNDCGRAKGIYTFVASTYKGLAEADEAKTRARTVLKQCK